MKQLICLPLKFSGLIAGLCLTVSAHAGLLETQSNVVASNFNPYAVGSWAGIPQFTNDTVGDGTLEGFDWSYTQVAHNSDFIFIRYHNSTNFAGDRQLMYFDTDLDRNTGLPGFSGNLAVGAEFYLSGAGLNTPSGFVDFVGWNNVQDGSGNWDILIAIDRAALMPGVTNFNFVCQNHGAVDDDWYPDAGNIGPGGDYFQYIAPASPPTPPGGPLETQNNPVRADFDPYVLANWTGLPKYLTETNADATSEGYDWSYTQVAHNEDWFYVHYHNSHPFAGDRQLMYFDTDTNRATGLRGFSGNLSIGAEFYLSGAALSTGGGAFVDFVGWNNTQDGGGQWDIFIAINRAQLMPGVTNFHFVNQNHGAATDDWYPDTANTGVSGNSFAYIAGPVPPTMTISLSGTDVTITWSNGVLEEADDVAGPYTEVIGATSPYTIPASATKKFYRARL